MKLKGVSVGGALTARDWADGEGARLTCFYHPSPTSQALPCLDAPPSPILSLALHPSACLLRCDAFWGACLLLFLTQAHTNTDVSLFCVPPTACIDGDARRPAHSICGFSLCLPSRGATLPCRTQRDAANSRIARSAARKLEHEKKRREGETQARQTRRDRALISRNPPFVDGTQKNAGGNEDKETQDHRPPAHPQHAPPRTDRCTLVRPPLPPSNSSPAPSFSFSNPMPPSRTHTSNTRCTEQACPHRSKARL